MASSLYKVARSYGSSRLNQIARRSTSSEAGSEVKNPHSSQDSYGEHIIPSKEPTVLACDSQVKQFREDGFVSIQELTSKEEVVQLREMYDYWFKNMVGREHGNFFDLAGTDEDGKVLSSPQMLWPSKYGLNLADSQLYANALAISKQLLGDETTFKGDHAICKAGSPASRPTPWHQDEAYWDNATNYEALGVWLALQPVTVEQGCMCFIPKSHRMGIFDHTSLDNNPKIHALQLLKETDHVKESEIVPIPLPAGGATFHHSKLLHYTGANTVEGSTRRAYTMSFQGSAEYATYYEACFEHIFDCLADRWQHLVIIRGLKRRPYVPSGLPRPVGTLGRRKGQLNLRILHKPSASDQVIARLCRAHLSRRQESPKHTVFPKPRHHTSLLVADIAS